MCTLLQGLSAAAQIGQGYSAAKSYDAQAQMANNNAALANSQANLVQEQKQQQVADINRQKRQTIGTQRAAMAASGSDSSYGTGLATITDTAYNAQKDINNTEYNAELNSWALRQQANDYRNQASIYKASAHNTKVGAVLGATGSYLSSLTPYASSSGSSGSGVSIPSSISSNFWNNNYSFGNDYSFSNYTKKKRSLWG